MKLIAEFEVETASYSEALPGESKFARLRRIAKAQCRPIRRVTTYLVPKDMSCDTPTMTMREASDYMLAQIVANPRAAKVGLGMVLVAFGAGFEVS